VSTIANDARSDNPCYRNKPKVIFSISQLLPTVSSKHHLHYMISQHAVQVSQRIIPRTCFKLRCLESDELSVIARRLQGLQIIILPHSRLSSSSTRWKSRQGKDLFARKAKVEGLKSRAAFKLLEVCIIV
jgi:hypothetical protein